MFWKEVNKTKKEREEWKELVREEEGELMQSEREVGESGRRYFSYLLPLGKRG